MPPTPSPTPQRATHVGRLELVDDGGLAAVVQTQTQHVDLLLPEAQPPRQLIQQPHFALVQDAIASQRSAQRPHRWAHPLAVWKKNKMKKYRKEFFYERKILAGKTRNIAVQEARVSQAAMPSAHPSLWQVSLLGRHKPPRATWSPDQRATRVPGGKTKINKSKTNKQTNKIR